MLDGSVENHAGPGGPTPRFETSLEKRAALLRDAEALLFAAGRPLSAEELTSALAYHGDVTLGEVEELLQEMESASPVDGPRGFELARVAGGWLLRTNRLAERALTALFSSSENGRLSPAAMEALAIVAYCQPVSRPQIADIRGVNSDSVLQTLLDREFVVEVGRREGPGGAILYGTTERFQVVFGLQNLESLPGLETFAPGPEERDELRRRLGLSLQE